VREPFIDQRRFPRAALGDKREDVNRRVRPRLVEALQFFVASDQALIGRFRKMNRVDFHGASRLYNFRINREAHFAR
jgi:hypothetical protein